MRRRRSAITNDSRSASLVALALILLTFAGWRLYEWNLARRVNVYLDQLRPLAVDYGAQFQPMTEATALDNGPLIAGLEATRAALRELEPPRPARLVHYTALRAMGYGIEGFWAQQAGAPDADVSAKWELSGVWSQRMTGLSNELRDIY